MPHADCDDACRFQKGLAVKRSRISLMMLFAEGIFCGYLVFERIYRPERRLEEDLSSPFTYIFVGTLIGAWFGHVLFYQPDYGLAEVPA